MLRKLLKKKIDAQFKGKEVFSLCHTNIRSSKAHISELTDCVNYLSQEFSVTGLSETWLTELDFDIYNIAEYTQCSKFRVGKIGGGVSLFMRNGIEFQLRYDISGIHEHTESLFIWNRQKIYRENTSTIIGVIYRHRPHNTNMQLSTEYIEGILETVKSERNICYMMGDYNIASLKSSVQSPTSDFLEMMYDKSFQTLFLD